MVGIVKSVVVAADARCQMPLSTSCTRCAAECRGNRGTGSRFSLTFSDTLSP